MGSAAEQLSYQETQEELQALPESQLKHLANVAKHDLFVMARGVLGMQDVNPQTHKAFCQFVQEDEPEKTRRMTLMPRIHLKTSVGTVANSIRKAVKKPDEYQGLIVGETETKAVDMLREIKGHWELNDTLKLLYPELVPPKFSGPGSDWAQTRATINRKKVLKQATWSALGKGGASVGGHWNHLTVDDIIGLEALESEAEMEKAKSFVKNISSLVVSPAKDVIDFYGTRWARNDVYAFIMKRFAGNLLVFRREAIENGLPIFPQKHTLATLAEIQQDPFVWFSQYCNNPLAAGQTDFPQDAVRTFYFDNEGRVCAWVDGEFLRWRLEELHIVMVCDPNSGSKTAEDDAAIEITGVDCRDNIFVLHSESGKPSPSQFVDRIFELYQRWHPIAMGIEEAGQQSTLHYFEKKSREEGIWPNIVTVKPKNRDKKRRIRTALEPILRSRRLFCLTTQTALRAQLQFFPDLELFDEIDALAYGAEPGLWRKPDTYVEQEERGRTLKLLTNRRNKLTGYS